MSGNGDHQDAPPKRSESEVEAIDVDGRCLDVIKPAGVYYTNGTVLELPRETIKAVDKFVVPEGFQRSGCCEQSLIYSFGAYVKP